MIDSLYSIMTEAKLPLPAVELSILLAGLACCLVFRFTRTGLIMAFLFIYRWGWLVLVNAGQGLLMAYLVFGMLIGIATVVGMLRAPTEH